MIDQPKEWLLRSAAIEGEAEIGAGMPPATGSHDWQTCEARDCDECQSLVDHGIVMACDGCGSPGLVDLDHHSWRIMPDGSVLCIGCYEATGLPDKFENENASAEAHE